MLDSGLFQLVSDPLCDPCPSHASLRYVKLDRLTLSCNVQKRTVLMYAIVAKMEALCDKLIEKGANINVKDRWVPPLSSIMRASATPMFAG